MDIQNTVSLVAGGASGLGRATVERLLARGSTVLLLDLPGSAGQAVARHLGPGVTFEPADVRDPDSVAVAVDRASELGDLRVAVNCAGTGEGIRTVSRDLKAYPLDRFRHVIEINLLGTFNVMRLAAARMAEQDLVGGERGVIVNTASVAAFDGQIGQAAYAASKAGIVGMTLPVARDLSTHGIRVVTIAPGLFDTPLLAELSDDAKAALVTHVPHPPRLGDPSEYGALVVHVVENPMINGETIRLDGAVRLPPR